MIGSFLTGVFSWQKWQIATVRPFFFEDDSQPEFSHHRFDILTENTSRYKL